MNSKKLFKELGYKKIFDTPDTICYLKDKDGQIFTITFNKETYAHVINKKKGIKIC